MNTLAVAVLSESIVKVVEDYTGVSLQEMGYGRRPVVVYSGDPSDVFDRFKALLSERGVLDIWNAGQRGAP